MPEIEAEPVPRIPRAEVRRRVLDAAARVFAEHGYVETRLDDVARAAGFTKGAVYSNFGSKQDLFVALLTERAQAIERDVDAELDRHHDAAVAIENVAAMMAEQLAREADRQQLLLEFASRAGRDATVREAFQPFRRERHARIARFFAAQAERLGVTLKVDADQAATILLALRNGLALEHGIDPENATVPVVAKAIAAVIAGLINPIPEP